MLSAHSGHVLYAQVSGSQPALAAMHLTGVSVFLLAKLYRRTTLRTHMCTCVDTGI